MQNDVSQLLLLGANGIIFKESQKILPLSGVPRERHTSLQEDLLSITEFVKNLNRTQLVERILIETEKSENNTAAFSGVRISAESHRSAKKSDQ